MNTIRAEYNKENIVLKIADIQMVKKINAEMITSKIMDLTVIYYYTLFHTQNMSVTIPLTKKMLEALDIERSDLYKLALENTLYLNPPEIKSFEEIVNHLNLSSMQQGYEERKKVSKDVYLVLNNYGMGSVYILDRNTLDLLVEKVDDDLAIIPSSRHEILVLAKNNRNLKTWVYSVKETHEVALENDERLSKSVYFYNRDTREFSYQNADDFLNDVNLP